MRTLGLVLVAASVVLVLVALHFAHARNATAHGTLAATGPEIVVAAAPFQFGDPITAHGLRLVHWPADAVPQGAFVSTAAILGNHQRRVALQAIAKGEPVLAGKISANGGRAALSSVIDPGMRAVTLRVDDATGVAGFILPNDRVDVLLTRMPIGRSGAPPVTEILLQDVKVLGLDRKEAKQRKAKPSRTAAKVVTVEVDPGDAEKLALAQQLGRLSLALRNVTSRRVVAVAPFTGAGLASGGAPDAIARPVATPDALAVTILRGAAVAQR